LNLFKHKRAWKLALLLFAVLIGLSSLLYTKNLVNKLKAEERENVELWAEATRMINSSDENQNLDFLKTVIDYNNTVPVILTDESDNIIASRNFDTIRIKESDYLKNNLERIKQKNIPIEIDLENNHYNLVYYKDSIILTMLIYYPYVQLGIIILFILVSYLAFSSSRKAEQNQVWVGMSKETAHQLGTPTSSLVGWIEILQQKHPEIEISRELAIDVERLEKITERFSRIGSKPSLKDEDIFALILQTVEYLKSRSSTKITFNLGFNTTQEFWVPVNDTLFEWVIENVSKNAIDAMEGDGEIKYQVTETEKNVLIDISDTGKGIPKSAFNKIFNPGYTTKQRGWGLGLSLAKRIIEEYHNGKIFVKHSEVGQGSSIRIILNKK
jgi:signal transduction histidine kinase